MNHREEVVNLLSKQIGNPEEVEEIGVTAQEVAEKWVDPLSGGTEETNGLIYGLVQSGKTGVLTVTGAIGADEGYRTILILTSDNDPLYEQTLGRAKEAFPAMDILGKADIKDRVLSPADKRKYVRNCHDKERWPSGYPHRKLQKGEPEGPVLPHHR